MHAINIIIKKAKKLRKKRQRIKRWMDKSVKKLNKIIAKYKEMIAQHKRTFICAHDMTLLNETQTHAPEETIYSDSSYYSFEKLSSPKRLQVGLIRHSTPCMKENLERGRPKTLNSLTENREFENIATVNNLSECMFKIVETAISYGEGCSEDDMENSRSAKRRKENPESETAANRQDHSKSIKSKTNIVKKAGKFKKETNEKKNYNKNNINVPVIRKSACNNIDKKNNNIRETLNYTHEKSKLKCNISKNNDNNTKELHLNDLLNKSKNASCKTQNVVVVDLSGSDEDEHKNNSMDKLWSLINGKVPKRASSDDELNQLQNELDELKDAHIILIFF
jgi:hypothetical protein